MIDGVVLYTRLVVVVIYYMHLYVLYGRMDVPIHSLKKSIWNKDDELGLDVISNWLTLGELRHLYIVCEQRQMLIFLLFQCEWGMEGMVNANAILVRFFVFYAFPWLWLRLG